MPTSRRAAVVRRSGVSAGMVRSFRSTSSRARCSSASVSTSASASCATSSATPLRRSSTAMARRANPRPVCRERTHCPANAASSISPTSSNRSSTAFAASSGTSRLRSACASSWRVRARSVSRCRQISRATATGSASSSRRSRSALDPAPFPLASDGRRPPPAPPPPDQRPPLRRPPRAPRSLVSLVSLVPRSPWPPPRVSPGGGLDGLTSSAAAVPRSASAPSAGGGVSAKVRGRARRRPGAGSPPRAQARRSTTGAGSPPGSRPRSDATGACGPAPARSARRATRCATSLPDDNGSPLPAGASPSRSVTSEVDRRGERLDIGVEHRADAELLLDALLDLGGDIGVVTQELAGVLLALPHLVAFVRVPGAGLADDPLLDAHVDERALAADADAVEDVELGLLERRRDLVLHHLDARAVADHVGPVLQRLDAADVEAHRGVELQRLAARGGLGRPEHDPDLLPELVDEDRGGAGVAQRASD